MFPMWSRRPSPTVTEIDERIKQLADDKHKHEARAFDALVVEVDAEQAVIAAQHELDRARRLREAEEVAATKDQDGIDRLLEERAKTPEQREG